MPATSSFTVPITNLQRKILTGYDDSPVNNQMSPSSSEEKPVDVELSPTTTTASKKAQPYQLVRIEHHSYSMIKYTKMVMNVTFK